MATNPPNESTTRRSLDVLNRAGSAPTVLDVGCGAGRASLHLAPPAVSIVGVDQSESLLAQFREEAAARRTPVETVLGDWNAVEADVPIADLVVCAQVVYNVPDIEPFLQALDRHAGSGVVLELDTTHPMTKLNGAWKYFWDLERPAGPTADDLIATLTEMGIEVRVDVIDLSSHKDRIGVADVERTRARLCLPAERDEEIRRFLEDEELPGRQLVTVWW